MNVAAKYTMCAEELSELIQACLKKVRIINNDNPTTINKFDVDKSINEEIADVLICIFFLIETEENIEEITKVIQYKLSRWNDRIKNRNDMDDVKDFILNTMLILKNE